MKKVTASEIKNNSSILQNALKEDLLVTKRGKPFVVIVNYDRYQKLINNHNSSWIEESFNILSNKEANELIEEIKNSRVNDIVIT